MSCTLRIKCGDVELDFSGEEAFVEKHFVPLIAPLVKAIELSEHKAVKHTKTPSAHSEDSKQNKQGLTTSTAATKLSAKSGTDLATAAAYVLHLNGKETFSRNELNQEMKSAKSYFKETFRKNLSNSIATLVKQGNMLDQGSDTYALSVECKAEIDKKLSE